MTYRKRGSVVRWENGTVVRVTESGVATETPERFECHPVPAPPLPFPELSPILETVRVVRSSALPVAIERLIVISGVAEHQYEGRAWTEESSRVHVALVRGPLRALIDTTMQRLDDVARIASALAVAGPVEQPPPRLRVAPCVAAALLPALRGVAPVVQVAGGVDAYGNAIVDASGEPWPNWYRPSYRMRPVRMPLNLQLAVKTVHVDDNLPVAVGLLAPPEGNAALVLVADGARAYPARIQVTAVAGAGPERVWYPYGGGSFGAELVL
jgi:hypothetical protein